MKATLTILAATVVIFSANATFADGHEGEVFCATEATTPTTIRVPRASAFSVTDTKNYCLRLSRSFGTLTMRLPDGFRFDEECTDLDLDEDGQYGPQCVVDRREDPGRYFRVVSTKAANASGQFVWTVRLANEPALAGYASICSGTVTKDNPCPTLLQTVLVEWEG